MEKNTLDTCYEFLFALALSAECKRRGASLDMSMMRISDKDLLSADDIAYMHYLRDNGAIYDGVIREVEDKKYKDKSLESNLKYYCNMEAITTLGDKLFNEENDKYYWDTSYAYKSYGKYAKELLHKRKIGSTILHLMAHMLVSFKLKEKEDKLVEFYFKTFEVATLYMFLDLLACERTLKVLKGRVKISLDEDYSDRVGDLDFNILFDTARRAGRLKKWSCEDKFKFFEKYGFKEGSIAILYERGRMCESNSIGTIQRSSVIRIDECITDLKKGAGWKITKLSVNKTIEESEGDYYGIDEEYRSIFSDLLYPKIGTMSTFMPFSGVGIGTYFLDEEYLMMPIERDEKVMKKVSIDGRLATIELDDVEAIYWILKEYNVDFDDTLYKEMYNEGKPLMWDNYDCTPVRR